jgi:PhnB protein
MASTLNPYLHFRDTAKAAMEFYQAAFGGDLNIMTFAENGDPYPGEGDKVMHAQLETPSGFTLMGSDTPNSMDHAAGTNHISISLSGRKSDDAELRGYWDKLSAGGNVTQALETAPWGDTFGYFTDKFGVDWLLNISSDD